MTITPDETVRSFCDEWANGDIESILSYFDDSAIYHNIPMSPANGLVEIRSFIEGFFATATSIDFEILHHYMFQLATLLVYMYKHLNN